MIKPPDLESRASVPGLLWGESEQELRHSRASERYYVALLLVLLAVLVAIAPLLRASTYLGSRETHAVLEMIGALLGLLVGAGFIARFYCLGQRFQLLVGLAYFLSGAGDLLHGMLEAAQARNWLELGESAEQRLMLATSASGRLWMALLLLLAPFVPHLMGRLRSTRHETVWVCLGVLSPALLSMLVAYVLPLPEMLFPEAFIARPLDFVAAVLYTAALAVFLREYHRTLEGLTWWLALSLGVNLIGQWLLSQSTAFYDPCFCAAHAYKALGYGVPLLGFSLYQTSTILELRRIRAFWRLDEQRLQVLLQLNAMTEASLHEITMFALEEGVRLTKSQIGYVAFTNADETTLTMYAWSQEAMAQCAIQDKPIIYEVAKTGLWGEAVRQRQPVLTNDYQAPNPLKKGYPAGHVPVARHLNLPVFDGHHIVIVAGVGNKAEDYDDADVRQLTLLMQGLWRLIQRKQTHDVLRASELRLRQIIDLVPHLIFAKDRAGRFVLANRAMAEAYGTTVEQLTGTTDADYSADRHELDHFRHNDLAVIESGESKFIPEETLIDAHGRRHVLQTTKIPFTAAHSTDQAVLGIAVDITQLKNLEMELRAARDELELRVQQRTAQWQKANQELAAARDAAEAGSRAKSAFLANMSHEIRTPMNAILGMTELLLDMPQPAQQREFLDAVHESGESLLALLNDILDFSKIEAGKLQLDSTIFDLPELVGDTMKSLAVRAPWQGPGTGLPRLSRRPQPGPGRPRAAAPDSDQPGGQCDQVH